MMMRIGSDTFTNMTDSALGQQGKNTVSAHIDGRWAGRIYFSYLTLHALG